MESRPLLTIPEVMAYLSLSKSKIHALIRENRLDAVRLGHRTTRITRDSLMRLIENATAQAQEGSNG